LRPLCYVIPALRHSTSTFHSRHFISGKEPTRICRLASRGLRTMRKCKDRWDRDLFVSSTSRWFRALQSFCLHCLQLDKSSCTIFHQASHVATKASLLQHEQGNRKQAYRERPFLDRIYEEKQPEELLRVRDETSAEHPRLLAHRCTEKACEDPSKCFTLRGLLIMPMVVDATMPCCA
jgi:hypothetical protein